MIQFPAVSYKMLNAEHKISFVLTREQSFIYPRQLQITYSKEALQAYPSLSSLSVM
jgi:hypothetical protein